MKDGIKGVLRRAGVMGMLFLLASAQLNSVGTPHVMLEASAVKVEASVKEVKKDSRQLHSKKQVSSWVKGGEFLGFALQAARIDTAITNALKSALLLYTGPGATISSLRRHHNCKSDHYSGNADDFEFCDKLIQYLVSDEGMSWLNAHSLYFFIEGKPGSRKVATYLKNASTASFVFFNPSATGNHIHLGVK